MTTSPESRARAVIERAMAIDTFVGFGNDHLEKVFTLAIREAENDALERAAVAALEALGGPAHTYASENGAIYQAQDHALATAAERIRSLKHKD